MCFSSDAVSSSIDTIYLRLNRRKIKRMCCENEPVQNQFNTALLGPEYTLLCARIRDVGEHQVAIGMRGQQYGLIRIVHYLGWRLC